MQFCDQVLVCDEITYNNNNNPFLMKPPLPTTTPDIGHVRTMERSNRTSVHRALLYPRKSYGSTLSKFLIPELKDGNFEEMFPYEEMQSSPSPS